jgi:hypothetical protein
VFTSRVQVLAKHFPQMDKALAAVVIVRSSLGASVLGPDGKGAALNAFRRAATLPHCNCVAC